MSMSSELSVGTSAAASASSSDLQAACDAPGEGEGRHVLYNLPLPPNLVDPDGLPTQTFARNKIRTTRYTPLSFIPKNLLFQFSNVANAYFLFMVVLGCFTIFGVDNPVLAAVPLIAIVAVTAAKDALEDTRRASQDLLLNNTPTHVLRGVPNVNVSTEHISLWRSIKKKTSHSLAHFSNYLKNRKLKNNIQLNDLAGPRSSISSFETIRRAPPHHTNSEISPSNEINFKKEYWKNVKVGDIIRIHNNEEIPADLAILSTSNLDSNSCYIETKNLDGETNLKQKQGLKLTSSLIHSKDFLNIGFYIDSELPHLNLYSYNGTFHQRQNDEDLIEPISINNVLLRGCTLRNTKWVIGIVLFTGIDSKIMLNAGETPSKKSRISKDLNFSVIMNFILLFILCLLTGIINGVFYTKNTSSALYFEYGSYASTPALNGILAFFVGLILYQSLVPISLYISIELIKSLQALFIHWDVLLYYKPLDYPCTPKSWNISDDLGQIEYIFSDKTGTLTQNIMEFKKCTINGKSYGLAYTEAMAGLQKQNGLINVDEEIKKQKFLISKDKSKMLKILHDSFNNDQLIDDNLTFISSDFALDLTTFEENDQKLSNQNFMLYLALCNSVLTEVDKFTSKIHLRAESPDEQALVGTARDVGFSLINRNSSGFLNLNIFNLKNLKFKILNVIPFDSTRKRMSVIVKIPKNLFKSDFKPPPIEEENENENENENDNKNYDIVLICKGADSIIYSRLDKLKNNQEILEKTALHLEQFATEGLRTLCISYKILTLQEYQIFNKNYIEASSSIIDRDLKIDKVSESLETDLILIGGTAIEDKLQDGVPDSIEILSKAGIKLWVLTGDKVETAINIGFSCNLLQNGMNLLVIRLENEQTIEEADKIISKLLLDNFNMFGSNDELEKAKLNHSPPIGNFAVIIDGDALKQIIGIDLQRKFLLLCKQCRSVLCCRVSPAQKAAVVRLVKNSLDVMTLAIGDGSNDVAMIQEADVGIGIAGEEGRQAAMSSDYAIAQFRFLTRLILIHGRWSYKRLSEMIPCFFYKNVVFTLALFWYGIYNDFDGSYLFEYTYLTFYNLVFTSAPVILLGVFDQDVDHSVSLAVPQLYRTGILRSEWNNTKFWYYMFDGIYQSVISFFYPFIIYQFTDFVSFNGLPVDHRYEIGMLVATISVISCNFYVLMRQYRWDILSIITVIGSTLFVFLWTGIWTSTTISGPFYHSAASTYSTLMFWTCTIVGVITCLMPRFIYDCVEKIYNPKDIDIIRERVVMGDFKNYPKNYDPTDPNVEKIHSNLSKLCDDEKINDNHNHNHNENENENEIEEEFIFNTTTNKQKDHLDLENPTSLYLQPSSSKNNSSLSVNEINNNNNGKIDSSLTLQPPQQSSNLLYSNNISNHGSTNSLDVSINTSIDMHIYDKEGVQQESIINNNTPTSPINMPKIMYNSNNNEDNSCPTLASIVKQESNILNPIQTTSSIQQSLENRRIEMIKNGQYMQRPSIDISSEFINGLSPLTPINSRISHLPRISIDARRPEFDWESSELPGLTNAEKLMNNHLQIENNDNESSCSRKSKKQSFGKRKLSRRWKK